MPAPVEFTVQIASLPPGFSGDPQSLAQAIAERLTVAPASLWSAFTVGASQPSSNVGPWFKDGIELKVWSDSDGTYISPVIDGSTAKVASIPLASLADGATANSLVTFGPDSKPLLKAGTAGQTLRVAADGTLAFVNAVDYFDVRLTSDQPYSSNGSQVAVGFDNVLVQSGVTWNTTTKQVAVTAGSLWHFDASVQIEDTVGGLTGVQHVLVIRQNGTGTSLGSVRNYSSAQPRDGLQASGLVYFSSDGVVDVSIATLTGASPAVNVAIAANSQSTRFCGYRLK